MDNGLNGNGKGTNGDGRGKHENSLANLQLFQSGVSGNPNGRPSGTAGLTKKLREIMDGEGFVIAEAELLDDKGNPTGKMSKVRLKMPRLEAIVNTAIHKALKGDMKAIEYVWEKYEGTDKTLNIRLGLLDDPDKANEYANRLRDAANTD